MIDVINVNIIYLIVKYQYLSVARNIFVLKLRLGDSPFCQTEIPGPQQIS